MCWSSRRSGTGSPRPPRPSRAPGSRARSSRRRSPTEVARRQALTAEAIALLDIAEEPPLEGIRDVRETAAHAALGGVLAAPALRHVGDTVSGSLRARAALEEQEAPLLRELAAAIDPALKPLAEAIDRAVEQDGSDLKDNASPKLRKLRGELRTGRQRVADRLEQLVRKKRHPRAPAGGLRHPARRPAGARGQGELAQQRARHRPRLLRLGPDALRRAVRDRRAQQPPGGGRRRRAGGGRADPARAVEPRLASRRTRSRAPSRPTGQIDLAVALGTVSRGWRGAAVEVSDEVRLVGARHPLLDPKTAVPIDLDLGGLRALVISGPNTGGKTVALKTLGLAALLHQSGLRPPADTAALPVFDAVLADIGDRAVDRDEPLDLLRPRRQPRRDPERGRERSLVLLDEVAAGTDPVEGSALAQALLARLAEQARLTVVTTHYAELKEWASATDGVANAATGFDPDTHAPLYRIALGRPGISHALQTAERLGLDARSSPTRVGGSRPSGCGSRSCSRRRRRPSGQPPRSARRRRASARRPPSCAPRSGRASRSSRPRSRRCARPPQPSASALPPRRCASWRRHARSSMRCGTRSGWRGAKRRRRAGARPPARRRLRARGAGGAARSGRSTSRCR